MSHIGTRANEAYTFLRQTLSLHKSCWSRQEDFAATAKHAMPGQALNVCVP
jgi:hypothetical protein